MPNGKTGPANKSVSKDKLRVHSQTGVNDFSIEYQVEVLNNLHQAVTTQLSNHIPYEEATNPKNVMKGITHSKHIEKPEDKLEASDFAQNLVNKIDTLTEQTLTALQAPNAPHNNVAIVEHIGGEHNSALKLVSDTRVVINSFLEEHENLDNKVVAKFKELNATLKKIDTYYQQQLAYLDEAMEPKLYVLEIPRKEYDALMKKSKRFYYEGKSVAAAKFGLGAAGAALSIGAAGTVLATMAVFLPTPSLLGEALSQNEASAEFLKLMSESAEAAINLLRQGASRYGYCCTEDLPSKWIAGRVEFREFSKIIDIDPDENRPIKDIQVVPVIVEKNNNYVNADKVQLNKAAPHSSDNVQVFLVDGGAAEQLFKNGTDYNLKAGTIADSIRGALVFDDPRAALLFSLYYAPNGKQYDVNGGFSPNGWKAVTRSVALAGKNAVKQQQAEVKKLEAETIKKAGKSPRSPS